MRYPFPFVKHPVRWKGLNFAGIKDIALMKAYVLGQRIEYKDYVDLYFLLKLKSVSLDWLIKECRQIYKGSFHSRLFLEQLVNMQDVKESNIKYIGKNRFLRKKEIQEFFEKEVQQIDI